MNIEMRQMSRYENSPLSQRSGISHSLPEHVRKMYGLASMEFNWLTFNGKAGPASTPLVIRQGERVRVRLINMGMDHHPIHLHGLRSGRPVARARASRNRHGREAIRLWWE